MTVNERRHERELVIKANDFVTGKDCVRIVASAVQHALDNIAAERQARFAALPWWRRLLRGSPE